MDVITPGTIGTLLSVSEGPCVSIYMPTHRRGQSVRQDPIRFKNLLEQAEAQLDEIGVRTDEVDDLLEPLRRLLTQPDFWNHQEDGLAAFRDPIETRTFRLPRPFPELAVVTEAHHVKPLWPLVTDDVGSAVLALSKGRVRLLAVDRHRVEEIPLTPGIPGSLDEFAEFSDPESQLQHRGADRIGSGELTARFHGHGDGERSDDARLEQYLRAVDSGIRGLVDSSTPLLLAGVTELTAAYRRVSLHPEIVTATIDGNQDDTSLSALQSRAVELMDSVSGNDAFDRDRAALERGGKAVMTDLRDVARASVAGRVAAVFVGEEVSVWGQVGDNGLDLEVHEAPEPGDRDLLDFVAAVTWTHGGRVHLVSDSIEVAALLRF